ncbi:MAG: hypothetical protein NZL98_07170, partial [Anaerolineales bacterium]|nr:hypothetical protein [Anaerolineales bacterium]
MVSVYLHIPFCTHRCAYCDFNTYAGQEAMIPAYVQALCREIQIIGENFPGLQVCTIFFGGGRGRGRLPTQHVHIAQRPGSLVGQAGVALAPRHRARRHARRA